MPVPGLPVQTPSQLVGDLLTRDPDAASILSEADHRRELADLSASEADQSSSAMQAARQRFDDLRHKLDPRGRRHVRVRAGFAALTLITVCLLILDVLEFRGTIGASATWPLALCATTIWLIAAWSGALAAREEHPALRNLIAVGAIVLGWLIAVMHALIPSHTIAARWHHIEVSVITIVLINALTIGASALIWRIEPSRVAEARAAWRQAQRGHRKAARQARRDTEAATVAAQAWFSLVRRHAIAAYADTDLDASQTVQAALAVAAALHQLGRLARSEHATPGA
jgi:hypothetical protein